MRNSSNASRSPVVRLDALEQVGRHRAQVALDRLAGVVAGDDHLLEVLVEDVADDLDEQVGLGVQQRRRLHRLDLRLMSAHCAVSRFTSSVSCSSVAPSAAVRTMTPTFSGSTSLRIFFRRARSVSGSLRLMPFIEPFGTYTR